jgi:putative transposase
MENKEKFDYKSFEQQAIKALQNGKPLEGKDGVLAPLIKRLVEAGLNGEMSAHLEEADVGNRRNGKTSKAVKTAFGKVDIITPRDRLSSFEPQLLAKRQTVLGDALDHKVYIYLSRSKLFLPILPEQFNKYFPMPKTRPA